MYPYYETDWSVLPPEHNRRYPSTMVYFLHKFIYRVKLRIMHCYVIVIAARKQCNRNSGYLNYVYVPFICIIIACAL